MVIQRNKQVCKCVHRKQSRMTGSSGQSESLNSFWTKYGVSRVSELSLYSDCVSFTAQIVFLMKHYFFCPAICKNCIVAALTGREMTRQARFAARFLQGSIGHKAE